MNPFDDVSGHCSLIYKGLYLACRRIGMEIGTMLTKRSSEPET